MTPTTPLRPPKMGWDPSRGKGCRINSDALPKLAVGGRWPLTIWQHGGIRFFRFQDHTLRWVGPMRMTVYGAPRALHPAAPDTLLQLDVERLRGFQRCVWEDGKLVMQGQTAKAPGYFVTQTAHQNLDYAPDDQRRYHDATTTHFLSIPLPLMVAAVRVGLPNILGCKAVVWDLAKANQLEMPVLDLDYFGGGCLSQRVFRDWSYGFRPDTAMPQVEVQLFPGEAFKGYELQDWRGE